MSIDPIVPTSWQHNHQRDQQKIEGVCCHVGHEDPVRQTSSCMKRQTKSNPNTIWNDFRCCHRLDSRLGQERRGPIDSQKLGEPKTTNLTRGTLTAGHM